MSREFLRLYRGIGDSRREGPQTSLHERLRVLNTLGYETGFRDSLVEPPQYHGRAARRRRDQPRRRQLPPLVSTTRRDPPIAASQPPLEISSSGRGAGGRLYRGVPTQPRERNAVDKSFSANKWSAKEREKLVEIYRSMTEPRNPILMGDFHRLVATRFRVFFPARTSEDTMQKLTELKRVNQLKALGETRPK